MSDNGQKENRTDYSFSDFIEDEIREASFKVSIYPHRILPSTLLIIIPVIFYIMFYGFFMILDATGLSEYSCGLKLVLFIVMIMGIFFFMMNCGREAVISGRGIVIRKFFLITESFSVSEVSRCEVITGLTTGGRYHHENYSKAVIYYGDGRKIYFEDNLYRGWDRLVRYMEMNKKVEMIDGRGFISKKLDEMIHK